MKLDGKVIVITGSTRGAGRAIAEACAAEGANVVISSRKPAAVKQTLAYFKKQGWKASGVAADVSKPADLKKLFKHAIKAWKKIDVWINNAGLSAGFRHLHEIPDDEIYHVINTNITGLLEASAMILPYFMRNKGVLINMTGLGSDGSAAPFTTVYACTKAAVTNLTRSLAKEYRKYPVSIHAVMPGMMDTDFFVNMKVGKGLEVRSKMMPVLIEAFGTPLKTAGKNFAEIAAQEPGKKTGRIYNFIGGFRRLTGIFKMIAAGISGKMKGNR